MKVRLRTACLLLTLAPAFALAVGKSYMTLVGELMGATESPRMIRDYCSKRAPSSEAENSLLYEGWKTRNRDLLSAVAEQLARANVRLKKQGAPGGDSPIEFMRKVATQQIEQALGNMTSADVAQYCSGYRQLIEKMDKEAETSIRQLLSVVENADQKLTEKNR